MAFGTELEQCAKCADHNTAGLDDSAVSGRSCSKYADISKLHACDWLTLRLLGGSVEMSLASPHKWAQHVMQHHSSSWCCHLRKEEETLFFVNKSVCLLI